jgi:hypothetical protein
MQQSCEKLKRFLRLRFLGKESEKFCKYILESTTLSEEEIQKIEFSEFLNYFNPKEEFDEKELEKFFDKLMSVPSSLATFLEKNSRLDEFYETASFIVQIKNLDLDDIINMNEEDFQRINEGMDKKKWEELYHFVQPQTSLDSPLYQEIEKILPNEIKKTHKLVINEIKKKYVAKSLYELELDDFPEIQKEKMSSFITSVDLLIYKDALSELLHKYGVFQEYKKLVFALNQSGVDFKNLLNDPNCATKILKEKFLMGEIVEEFTSILNFLSIFKDNSNHDIVLDAAYKSTDISKSLEIFCDFDSNVISNLTNKINNLINSLNAELSPLNVEMNQILIGMFHELAMLVTWYIHSCLEYYKCYEHIRLNQKEKAKMKDLFVSILTNDVGSADKLISTKIFDTILTFLNDQAFNQAKRVFDQEVKKYDQDFEPHHTMQYLDNVIQSGQNTDVIDVIINPENVLENLFDKKWKEVEYFAVENSQKTWGTIVSNKWVSLEKYFNDFYEHLNNLNFLMPSINMFSFANFSGENQEVYLQLKEENKLQTYVCKYFLGSLKGDWQNLKENCGNYEIVSSFPTIQPLNDADILNILTPALEGMKIGNLGVVIHTLLEIIRENLKNLNKNIPGYSQLDSNGLQKDFKNKCIGCNVHCGLCGRKCDENHTPQKVNHKCLSGHRFKVFGGSKIDKSNFPSFISCNEMKDDNKVQFKGKIIYQ